MNAAQWITLILLLAVVSFVSYRTVRALSQSKSSGLFRTFASVPIVYFFLLLAAAPIIILLKLFGLITARNSVQQNTPFVGSKVSQVYHLAGCEYEEVMGRDKRVGFQSRADAKAKGYRPCATCKPHVNE